MFFKKSKEQADKEKDLDEKIRRRRKEMKEAKHKLDKLLGNLDGVTEDVAGAFE